MGKVGTLASVAAPEVAIPAQAVIGAVGKAGQIVSRPVWGRRRTLTYPTVIERDGIEVEATVVEEDSRAIPGWLAAIGGAVAVVVGLGAAASVSSAAQTAKGEDISVQEVYIERGEDKKLLKLRQAEAKEKSFLGLGILANPLAGSSDSERQANAILDARQKRIDAWRKARDAKSDKKGGITFVPDATGGHYQDLSSGQSYASDQATIAAHSRHGREKYIP